MTLIDHVLIAIGCFTIGAEYSTALGWGLWFICLGFFKREKE